MSEQPAPRYPEEPPRPWYRELTGYHWFVLIVCTLGWLFDCGDQQIFNLARKPAMAALNGVDQTSPVADWWGGWATSLMLVGWATGGIIFGIMGDRIGRAKTMVWTILCYSIFTGLGGLSQTVWDFLFFRFMTGLGVGGQFAVGVSLVAEVMPERARSPALGLLQAFSALGNASAALLVMGISQMEAAGLIATDTSWRWMFFIGVVPALLAVVVISHLKEPERWQKAVGQDDAHKKKAGSLGELFGTPRWRRNVIVGMLLASAGVIGLWGIGFFSIDLNRSAFRKSQEQHYRDEGEAGRDREFLRALVRSPAGMEAVTDKKTSIQPQSLLSLEADNRDPRVLLEAMLALDTQGKPISVASVLSALDAPTEKRPAQTPEERARREAYLASQPAAGVDLGAEIARIQARYTEINEHVGFWAAMTSIMFNIGAFFGIYLFSRVTQRIGRRPTFTIFFLAAFVATTIAFLFMDTEVEVFWMVPLMGFFQLSVFGGYAIYFPELFPTRLRSTGTSFCYNIARYVSAAGPAVLGILSSNVFGDWEEPMRPAGVAMSVIFLLGIVVVYFAPETKDQPLPE